MLKDTVLFVVAGDWHGNANYAAKALHHVHKKQIEVIVHVGDFGFDPNKRFLNFVEQNAAAAGITVLVIDGNHEHHDWLNAQDIDKDGVRRLTEHVWHLPRGFRWDWQGVTFVALGGAYSVDQGWRTPYVDWFPQETISIKDAYTAVEGGPADVMFTHDAPDAVAIPLSDGSWIPEEHLYKAQRHREFLGQVVNNITPKHLYHGHYHVRYDAQRINENGTKTQVHGLDMDKRPFDQNMIELNVCDFMF